MSSDHSGSQKTRMATINFTIPAARLGLPKDSYMTLEPGRERPYESVQVPITDLRSDLEDSVSVEEQLYRRAFAVSRIEYDGLDDIPSLEGTERYLESCRQCVSHLSTSHECAYIQNNRKGHWMFSNHSVELDSQAERSRASQI